MKLFSLVLALFISVVVAYDIPGAYERVFLWYAREIDAKTRIAPDCPRPCSFNQFVAYISDPRLNPVPNIIDENDRLPKVNTAVKALLAKGLSEQYDFGRILNGASSTAELITKAVEFMSSGAGTIAQKKGIRNSINGIRFYRTEASSKAKIEALRKKWPDIAIKTTPTTLQLDDGSKVTLQLLDINNTIQSNQNIPRNEIGDVIRSKTDGSHNANIDAAKEGYVELTACKA